MCISEGKASAVKVNLCLIVRKVAFPKSCTLTATRVHEPPGHRSGPVLSESGTVSGVKQFVMTTVRGCFCAENVSTQSGAANRGLSSQGSMEPHARTTLNGAMIGTAITMPSNRANIAKPTSPDFVRTASMRTARTPSIGPENAIDHTRTARTRGSSRP